MHKWDAFVNKIVVFDVLWVEILLSELRTLNFDLVLWIESTDGAVEPGTCLEDEATILCRYNQVAASDKDFTCRTNRTLLIFEVH